MGWTWLTDEIAVTPPSYDASWHTVDISAAVPAGTLAAWVHIRNTGATYYAFGLRPMANNTHATATLQVGCHTYALIPLDANRQFKIQVGNAAVLLGIVGYTDGGNWITGTSYTDKSIAVTGSYETIDVAANVPVSSKLAYVIEKNTSAGSYYKQALKTMTGVENDAAIYGMISNTGQSATPIGLDASYQFLHQIDNANSDLWLIGSDLNTGAFLDTAIDITPSAGSWQTVDISAHAPAATAAMVLLRNNHGSVSKKCLVRPHGSVDDFNASGLLKLGNICPAVVQVNSGLIDVYVEDTNAKVYLRGYYFNPAVTLDIDKYFSLWLGLLSPNIGPISKSIKNQFNMGMEFSF